MSHFFSVEQLEMSLVHKLNSHSFFLEGEEVQRWANGMFSNNIRKLQPNQGNYSAICDDRGRVQGFLYLYCLNKEKFLCLLDGISLDFFVKRFQMYMVLDDIELDETGFQLFHFCGTDIEATLALNGLPIPDKDQIIALPDGFIFSSNRLGLRGYDLLHNNPDWLSQTRKLHIISEEQADAVRIVHGRAKWPQDGTDKSMIHELDLNEECCAFDKGCYVGQEIINRLDVKGLIHKKISRLALIEGPHLDDNSQIELFQDEKKMGSLSSFTTIQDHGSIKQVGLGTIRKAAWEKGTLLKSQHGQIWTVL